MLMLTSASHDYLYLLCISITGESPVVTDDRHLDLSGLQSAIKMLLREKAIIDAPHASSSHAKLSTNLLFFNRCDLMMLRRMAACLYFP